MTPRQDDRNPRSGNDTANRSTSDNRQGRNGGRNDDNGRRGPFDNSTGRGTYDRSNPGNRGSYDRNDRGGAPFRNRPSRSGTVAYGTFHNGYGSARPTRYDGGFNHSVLGLQIRRNQPHRGGYGDYHYGGVYGGVRYGYVGYNSYWRDDYFAYPFYAFDPWAPGVTVVASPWYRYSYLPPYLDTTRVVIVNDYRSSYNDRRDDWQDYREQRDDRLDNALGDIRDAFERNSSRDGERLLPQTGQVAIFNDGKYDYSLGADDFQDMFLDGIEQSKTVRYEITETRVRGDEVHLKARHEYTDSWGESQVVAHTYTLRRENGRFVIREFGTD